MNATSTRCGALIAAILLWEVGVCLAAPLPQGHGHLDGRVTDSRGIPQMGAAVLLLDHQDRLIKKVLTDEKGSFRFATLVPDVYSIQVTLASFLPTLRRNVAVQPGMRSFLAINLANVLSSVELVYTAPGQTSIMSDDWKWVLRSASATRPVLRLLPELDGARSRSPHKATAVFSDTRGLLRISAGDGASYGNEADLGTAFAVATSVLGPNEVKFSGSLGYASNAGIPVAGFRTSFHREIGNSAPEIKLTMRQLTLSPHSGAAAWNGWQEGSPGLRTLSVTTTDRTELSEVLRLEYGFSLDSVSFLERRTYASPFARLSYDLSDVGTIEMAYHSGLPPAEFFLGSSGNSTDMQQDLSAVSLFPRVSFRNREVKVQRVQNFELGYSKTVGSRKYRAGAYRETITNAALMMSSPDGLYDTGDLMPDLASPSSIFNAGNYSSMGFTAAVTQNFGPAMSATVSYGNGGVLVADRTSLSSNDPDELRGAIRSDRRHWTAARVNAEAPWTRTHVTLGYRWTDYSALTPGHAWAMQGAFPDIGLNLCVRQPIPNFPGVPGHWEATADLRNLLSQGYVPIDTVTGRRLLLMQIPRSVRGGLSFVF